MKYAVLLFLSVAVGCGGEPENNDVVTTCVALTCADVGTPDEDSGGDDADAGSTADASMPQPDAGGADSGSEPDAEVRPVLAASEGHESDILYGWVAAGQPSEARVEEIVATGATIISLRLPAEDPFDEPGLIDSLGGEFIRYPTSSADYDRVDFRESMYDLYDEQLDAGKIVYLHCASSNRVGASWALYQAERKGVAAEEAIAMGKAAGLGSLETRVREVLGI